MHILKIIHGYPPYFNAGSEVYSQSICNELSKSNQVSVFTREENAYARHFSIRHQDGGQNLDLYFVNNPQDKDRYRNPEIDENFRILLKKIKPDIAHVGHLNHLSTGLIDTLNEERIPIVFTLHDFWLMCPRGQFLTRSIGQENNFQVCSKQEDQKCAQDCYKVNFGGQSDDEKVELDYWSSWVSSRMKETKSLVDKVDRFIAPSKYLQKRFIDDFEIPTAKIQFLDYGFLTENLNTLERASSNGQYVFGYIGTHNPAKGVHLLIEAFKRIELPAKLLIFGRENGKYTNSLKQLADGYGNHIEFRGEYANKDLVEKVLSNVDCIVVPSIWGENSPLVIHEAQECKVPVITADYGGMKEYVQHQVNGLLFEHRSIDSLVEQLNFAAQNPTKIQGLGSIGYLFSNDGTVPDIQAHCNQLVKTYEDVINSKNIWRVTIDTNPEDCNLKCIMCEEHSPYSDYIPTLYKETGIKRRRMQIETVEDIFQQAKELGVREIIPSTMGEPLLYKGIEKVFELARKDNIKINLTTNGTFPRKSVEEWAQVIVPETSDVKISWNGASAETTEKVMLGLKFQQAVENVKRFINYRDQHFKTTGYYCRVSFQLTFMQNNMHELADIVKLAASLGVDRVKGHQLWAHFNEIKDLSMKANQEGIEAWNTYVEEAHKAQDIHRLGDGKKVILENIIPLNKDEDKQLPDEYECPFLAKELWISATGKISPCCAPDKLRNSLGDFGNIKDNSLKDVLNGELYQDLVKNYKERELCKSCNMRKPIK